MSNEFFDREVGRMGGFGWAARRSAECFASHPDLGYGPLLLAGKGELRPDVPPHSNGVPLLRYDTTRRYARAVRSANPAFALTIDYRPNYLPVLRALEGVPIVVWVRDPRTPEDVAKIATLRLPAGADQPAGVGAIDCTSLGSFVEEVAARGTHVLVAATAPELATAKVGRVYGLETSDVPLLPNPLDLAPESRKATRPTVVFLGRLDPIKRPWVFVELARRFPSVEFVALGRAHFAGEGGWQPSDVPDNVRLLGHVDQQAKSAILGSAWMLVNTAIHEGLAISFLEALHHATPVVSCQDPERVTSRFGVYVGRWDGSGLDALDAFADAVQRLLDDEALRTRLGDKGREWVRRTHSREHFAAAFTRLTTA